MIFGRRKVGAYSESLVDIFGNLLFVPAGLLKTRGAGVPCRDSLRGRGLRPRLAPMVRARIRSVEAGTVDVGRDRRVDEILEPLTAAHGTAHLRGRDALAHVRQQMQRRTVTQALGQRGQRESGAARHDEFHLAREEVRAAPRRDVEERVGADQEEQPVARAEGAAEPAHRVDRVGGAGDEIRVLQPRGHERALTRGREDDHGMAVVEWRDSAGALVRGDTRRNEQDFLEHELTPSGAGDGEMPAVDRIERAAEEGDVHGPAWMAMIRAGVGPPADSRAAGGPPPRRTAWSI